MFESKEEIRNASKVMLAYTEGKTIQSKLANHEDSEWIDVKNPVWNWYDFNYRIKPEPEYRPYNSIDEFIEASYMHGQYLMRTDGSLYMPVQINKGGITVVYGNGEYSYKYDRILNEFLWKDGSRCGKLVNG